MGGTFSPPHIGHQTSAKVFIDEMKLKRLIIIPAKVSPFKVDMQATASDSDRMQMTKLCFLPLDSEKCKVEVSDIEMSKDGASFTIDTIITICAILSVCAIFTIDAILAVYTIFTI